MFGVVGLLVLGTALYVVKRGPWLTGFALVLALPVVVLSIWLAFDFDPRRMVIMAALEAAFYFYAAGSLIAYMLEDEVASVDELFAAAATFTLLAWAFAYLYVVCQALLPGSFSALAGSGNPRTWMELLFLSFTTLSGVGLGDSAPPANGPGPGHDRGVLGRDVPRPGRVTLDCAVRHGANCAVNQR